ncbi:Retrovirus-related Pol polyprotein from type-1 retrotransposable element R1 2 [Aphis craccivora]|uniref:Retrovirus-related Pol polyprotein from type-1 retrotransposable element R1 2 n=1 Tax=Aphis craccivora TaxID=307492 RepID=A0A6G0XZK6_APHCR|nr:Retrovirus-related Pol polyprotein from type-1 retrotransposable element R1 2 [Aphis craccivora]
MLNVGGAFHNKRKIFGAIVYNQTLYAASIWAHALEFDMNKTTLRKPQRIIAQRIAIGYRMVFTQAILVVAGIISVHLMDLERLKSHKDRTRKDTLREKSFTK